MDDAKSDLENSNNLNDNTAVVTNDDDDAWHLSPAKIERRYELQRKIDEQLRKLQLADEMEQVNGNIKTKSDESDVTDANELALKSENGQLPAHQVINDDKLDGNGETAVEQNESTEELIDEETIQSSKKNEIDTFTDSHHARVNQAQSSSADLVECNSLPSQEPEVLTAHVPQSIDTDSDIGARSSSMTSPTTTAGTFTLSLQSPETEEDFRDEILPVDQVPPTFCDPLECAVTAPSSQGVDVTESSSEVSICKEQTPVKSGTEVTTIVTSSHASGLSPDGSIDGAPPNKAPLDMPSPDLPSESEAVAPVLACTNAVEANHDMEPMELNQDEDSSVDLQNSRAYVGEILVPPASFGENSIGAEYRSVLVDDKLDETMIRQENSADSLEYSVEQNEGGLKENAGDAEVPIDADTLSSDVADVEYSHALTEVEVDCSLITEQNMMEESLDRKISTDEDEYSGYDIDIGSPSCYQEEISIAGEDFLTEDNTVDDEIKVGPACDSENVPLFADVKYTIGEQIDVQHQQTGDKENENDNKTPTEEISSPDYPEIVPWDSHGQLRDDDSTSVQDESFPSDKADSGSSSSKSSISEEDFDQETSAKIAAETVCNAIKAAYEIACNNSSDDGDDHVSKSDNTSGAVQENSNYSAPGVENITPVTGAKVGNAATKSSEIQGDSADELSPSHLAEARENDITHNEEENVVAIEFTGIGQPHTDEDAAQFVGELDVPADLPSDSEVTSLRKEESDEIRQYVEGQLSEVVSDVHQESPEEDISAQVESDQNAEKNVTTKEVLKSEEEDMVKINESSGQTRNFPERIIYNPALSQRNTEATKWFGQPTSEDKIKLKPRGKVDENAEMERKRVIKAMTRKHNPHLVPKWQPPREKDFTQSLDEKQKTSLQQYEERRRSRSDAAVRNGTQATISTVPTIEESSNQSPTTTSQLPRENIVIDSVVHSRDAISIWESRLSEKHQKEELERQRLSIRKQKKVRERASSDIMRPRTDSTSSASSSASVVLPTSEHIERDSMDVSKVRNRWKNIEEESTKAKPTTVVKKESSSRRSNFSVNTANSYRSHQSPMPAAPRPSSVDAINAPRGGPRVKTSQGNESFIDREIREAAEREEKWKHEQWEKMSEISAASSEEVFPDNIPTLSTDSKVVTSVHTRSIPVEDAIALDVLNDADREESWKAEHDSKKTGTRATQHLSKDSSGIGSDATSPPPQRHEQEHKETDSESLSSYGSSGVGGSGLVSPTLLASLAKDNINFEGKTSDFSHKKQETAYHGIESYVTADNKSEEDEGRVRRQRIASLTNAVTPKGWEPSKSRAVGPVSHVNPVHRSVLKPEVKSPKLQPVHEQLVAQNDNPAVFSPPPSLTNQMPVTTNGNGTSSPPSSTKEVVPDVKDAGSPFIKVTNEKEIQGTRRGGQIFEKKSGPVVSSSKSRLTAVMEKEMQDAAAREGEWRRKQLELVNQGINLSPHPVVHSTREIRTPSGAAPPPLPANSEQPQVQLRRPVKSLFADEDDESFGEIQDGASNEYGKHAVVKAMRVPKRKSQLAMRWEEGQFQNNVSGENQ